MDIEILHLVSVVKQRIFASQTDMSAVCVTLIRLY